MAGPAAIENGPTLSADQRRSALQDTINEIRQHLKHVQILVTEKKELFIINVTTKCVHRPDPFETNKATADWKANGVTAN